MIGRIAHVEFNSPSPPLRPPLPLVYPERKPSAHYIRWQDGAIRIGCFEDYPDYRTQGQSLSQLEANLRDLYLDLTGGAIPGIRIGA